MTDEKRDERREPDPELVEDLDPSEELAEEVRGGQPATNQSKTVDKTYTNWAGYIRG